MTSIEEALERLRWPAYNHLFLTDCDFDAAAFAQTIEAIKAAPWVTCLQFLHMRTLDAVQVARVITATRRIKQVYVCTCHVTDNGVAAVCAALADANVADVELQLILLTKPKLGVAGAVAVTDLLRSGCDVTSLSLVHCWGSSADAAAAAHIAAALAENRTVEYFRFQEMPNDTIRRSFEDAMHCNLDVKRGAYVRRLGRRRMARRGKRGSRANRRRTHAAAARRTARDFDALPNEMLCAIAERMWPTEAALTAFVHVCARFRDCMLSDYVVKHRHGRRPDNGQWTSGDQRFFYRRIALDCMAL